MVALLKLLPPLLVITSALCIAAGRTASGSGSADGENAATPIHLNFMFISSNSDSFRSWGSIPAVDIALEMVNASGILGNYLLQYTEPLDSQCDRTQSLDVFHEAVKDNNEFVQNIAIIGAGCSVASIPIAEISHYYNIPMISWTSGAAELSDRHKFRKFYRLAPSEEIHSPGLAGLLGHYGWKQFAILTQTESLFLDGQKVVTGLLPDVDISIREFATKENPLDVEDLFVEGVDMRVFVLNMYRNHAKTILCAAHRLGMHYPRFLWITPGWYGDLWWTKELPEGCSGEDMEDVLDYSLSAVQYPIFSETEVSELGISTEQFRQFYGLRLYTEALKGNFYEPDLTAPLAFEAVWTLARALSLTIGKIEMGEEGGCTGKAGGLVPLEMFNYGNEKLGCVLQESIDDLRFLGISGYVEFDDTGNRISNSVRISQYRKGTGRDGAMGTPLIAYAVFEGGLALQTGANISSIELQFVNDGTNISLWPDGVTPDGVPVEQIVTTALPLTVIYYILAGVGIVFALVCLGFNVIFRKRKVVRLTSPNLNYLIIAGVILLYISVFFWVSPAPDQDMATILCNFRVWLFSLGNTLCLAVVLSKMWRVYHIFSAPSPKRKPKPPQDWHLLIIIGVIVAIDFIILLVPTAIESARLHGQLTRSDEHTATEDSLGVQQDYYYYSCYSTSEIIWLFISYVYKFLLQIAAIYFAFMTRKIKVKALNDSKQIAAIIYITSLLLIISLFGFWIGLVYLNTSTAIFAAAQMLTATVILGFLFIPKMINLRLDPDGDNIFASVHYTGGTNSTDILDSSQSNKMKELKVRVKDLESELERYQMTDTENTMNSMYTIKTASPLTIAFSEDAYTDTDGSGVQVNHGTTMTTAVNGTNSANRSDDLEANEASRDNTQL